MSVRLGPLMRWPPHCGLCRAPMDQPGVAYTCGRGDFFHDECARRHWLRSDFRASCPACHAPGFYEDVLDPAAADPRLPFSEARRRASEAAALRDEHHFANSTARPTRARRLDLTRSVPEAAADSEDPPDSIEEEHLPRRRPSASAAPAAPTRPPTRPQPPPPPRRAVRPPNARPRLAPPFDAPVDDDEDDPIED